MKERRCAQNLNEIAVPMTISWLPRAVTTFCLVLCLAAALALPCNAQHASGAEPDLAPVAITTMFPHSDQTRWLIFGQANIIFQSHPGFHSPYEGSNSLLARGEYKTSLIGTLYTGYELKRDPHYATDLLFDVESAGGRGISEALGLAGFTNLDVVRNPNLGSTPYVARAQLHQVIGLSRELAPVARTPFSLPTQVPLRRIDLHIGRMGLPDYLDINAVGSDSHLQFMNWTADNNGAWDYAADTRGYTYAVVAEYDDKAWSARGALALMPTVANGIDVEWNLRRARGENFEAEYRKASLARLLSRLGGSHGGADRVGAVRLLGYVNYADMGVYRVQNQAALAQRGSGDPNAAPVITAHAPATTLKYGFGINTDQQLTSDIRAYGRFGWNEGQHESFAYTEVDQTVALGADMAGNRWSRPNDRIGITGVSNAIKRDHQGYLALGGKGFLLGDGRLNYAREDILEAYYTAHNWRGLFSAFDVQLIAHPGYNQDRGPVAVFSVRTHVDF